MNYTLNGQDKVTTYADPRSLQTTYVRNGFGEVIQEVSPDRGTTTHVRDTRGLVTQTTDGRGIVTNMTYDAAGRIKTKTYPAATAENVTYTYDASTAVNWGKGYLTRLRSQDALIDFSYESRGNIKTEKRTIGAFLHTVTYAYNTADQVTQIQYPSGRLVNYTRDTTGRITQVRTKKLGSDPTWTVVASAIAREPMGNLVRSLTYGNGLTEANTYTLDQELSRGQVLNGATAVLDRTLARSDNLNITAITDGITSVRNVSFWHEPANRLQNADASGQWGTKVFYYDAVGNRIEERTTPPGGSLTTDVYGYGATNNRLVQITQGMTTVRSLAYDNAGNLTSDGGLAGSRTYTYNKRNRLSNALIGAISWDYTYNGLEQLIIRQRTGGTAPGDLTHYVHDIWGNIIAESDGSGPTGTVREYIYLPEVEIAPTFGSRTTVDRPIGVVEGVNTASPVLWFVHVDHLNRPVKMTDAAKAAVWDAVFLPWGGVHAITGSATMDARFPGQWFQLESGLHYNWHRQYDPSIGRYTQPDPLGFVDGPSVYGYARGGPQAQIDIDGRQASGPISSPSFGSEQCRVALSNNCQRCLSACDSGSTAIERFCRTTPMPPPAKALCWG